MEDERSPKISRSAKMKLRGCIVSANDLKSFLDNNTQEYDHIAVRVEGGAVIFEVVEEG